MRRSLQGFLVSAVSLLGACAPEGPTAFVTNNIVPDQSCVVSGDTGSLALQFGQYDIRRGVGTSCQNSYRMNLQVNSFLRSNSDAPLGRAEPNILQIHSAKVKLTNLQGGLFDFNDANDNSRPNPFLTNTNVSLFPSDGDSPSTGVAGVEVIPADYASKLSAQAGMQIKAEIQLFGTTTGDVDIEFKPFTYNIDICDGCLYLCGVPPDMMAEDVYGDECADNAGADGRPCIDFDCLPGGM